MTTPQKTASTIALLALIGGGVYFFAHHQQPVTPVVGSCFEWGSDGKIRYFPCEHKSKAECAAQGKVMGYIVGHDYKAGLDFDSQYCVPSDPPTPASPWGGNVVGPVITGSIPIKPAPKPRPNCDPLHPKPAGAYCRDGGLWHEGKRVGR